MNLTRNLCRSCWTKQCLQTETELIIFRNFVKTNTNTGSLNSFRPSSALSTSDIRQTRTIQPLTTKKSKHISINNSPATTNLWKTKWKLFQKMPYYVSVDIILWQLFTKSLNHNKDPNKSHITHSLTKCLRTLPMIWSWAREMQTYRPPIRRTRPISANTFSTFKMTSGLSSVKMASRVPLSRTTLKLPSGKSI